MQACKNCKQDFSFCQIYKSFWLGYRPITCANCGAKNGHSFRNRWLGGLTVGIGLLFGGLAQSALEISFTYKMLISALLTILIMTLLSRLFVRFMIFEKQ